MASEGPNATKRAMRAGEGDKRTATGGSGILAVKRCTVTTGVAPHDASRGQEAGAHPPTNGKGESSVTDTVADVCGSNYPAHPVNRSDTHSSCTSTPVKHVATVGSVGRPGSDTHRFRSSVVARARSNAGALSVAENSQTILKSMSSTARVQGGTALKVQHSESNETPQLSSNARGGRVMGNRRDRWCYPGRGTPVGSRAPPFEVAARIPEQETTNWPLKGRGPEEPVAENRAAGDKQGRSLERICELVPSGGLGESIDASNTDSDICVAKDRRALSQRESNNRGDFSETDSSDDSIYAIDPSGNRVTNCSPGPVLPVSQARMRTGERADYLSEFTEAVGGEVTLSRRHHTAWVQVFSGCKAHRTQAATVLLDTGSPASFIQRKVWKRMMACGAASEDGLSEPGPKTWGGFHGVPLITRECVRLNVQLWKGGREAAGIVGSPTVQLPVIAHVVPNEAMTHAVLLGRDSWSSFPVRKYCDVSETETEVTFASLDGVPAARTADYHKWVEGAVGMVESTTTGGVVARFDGKRHWVPHAMSWVTVNVSKPDGSVADAGNYYIRWNKGGRRVKQ